MRHALALFLIAAAARADEPPPVLHEYVPPPRATSRVVGNPANPTAIRNGSRVLVEPSPAQPPGSEEIAHGSESVAADRETEAKPDYLTQQDGTLHYSEVFNPSVVPFKRMTALDAVRADYTLYIRDHAPQDITVGGQADAERDLFWASLVVDFGADDVPIPSVAPDMRILSVEVEPHAKVSFARDAADNYYLRSSAGGRHRVVFLCDAPAFYFAPQVPAGYTVADVAGLRPAPPVPPRVRSAAAVMLARLRINERTAYDEAVNRLVEYFRGFEAGAPPSATGDVYLDLALSRRGVCRHRAFAFVVTALAAGIPARYLSNEAHAWAEVWAPQKGWMRVDLGGAALELDVANASDKTIHKPRGKDPFPKPRAYAEGYTRLKGDVKGLSPEQLAEANAPAASAGDPRSTDPVEPAPGSHLPRVATAAGKRNLSLNIDSVDHEGYRGENARAGGRVRDGTKGIEGLRVDVYFAPAGRNGEGARLLGQTVTGPGGVFSVSVELPLDLGLGAHEVFAATPGDARYGPAVSD